MSKPNSTLVESRATCRGCLAFSKDIFKANPATSAGCPTRPSQFSLFQNNLRRCAVTPLKIVVTLAAAMLAVSISFHRGPVSAAQQDLPDGKGVELARDKCVTCHEADLIIAQRLSKQGWTREVEKMIRWGAVVNDTEKETLVEYFSAAFPQRKMVAVVATNEARGKQIFEDKCLVCHEVDLTEAQRLSKQGWTREVEKMIRWGATVTDAEKEPLVEYLAKSYGPRPMTSER
jgi:cytochrome c5